MAAAVVHRLVKAKLAIKWQCLIQAPLQFVDLTLPSYQQNVPSNQLNILTYSGLQRFLKEYLTIPSVTESMLETNSHVEQKQRQNVVDNGYLSRDFIPEHYRQGYESKNKSENKSEVTAEKSVFFNEDLSPLIASDDLLRECPSTHLITTEFDIFRDDSYIYAGRLNKLGVDATLKDYENGYHGALNLYQNEKFKFPKILFNDFVEFLLKNL
jgi:acetyl esterase/lipase